VKVIPILLREAPTHPRLEALQYIDFTNPKVRPWDRLIDEIQRVRTSGTTQANHQEAQAMCSASTREYAGEVQHVLLLGELQSEPSPDGDGSVQA
jgi:hypothetical protein